MGKTERGNRAVPLDRRRIAAAAMALIDELGIEQVSMRKLGAALDVEAMALYHHFKNKAELLDGVLDLLLDELVASLPVEGKPVTRIRATFDAMRASAVQHPHVYPAMVLRRFRTQRALEFYEDLLQLFSDAGLDARQSARYYRIFANFTVGAGIADVGSRARHTDAAPVILESFDRPREFPLITAAVPYLRVTELDGIYTAGMDLLFDALGKELGRKGEP